MISIVLCSLKMLRNIRSVMMDSRLSSRGRSKVSRSWDDGIMKNGILLVVVALLFPKLKQTLKSRYGKIARIKGVT